MVDCRYMLFGMPLSILFLQITDIITTAVGLSLGAMELNPLGFSAKTIFIKLLLSVVFCCTCYLMLKSERMAKTKYDKMMCNMGKIISMVIMAYSAIIVVNNITVILSLI